MPEHTPRAAEELRKVANAARRIVAATEDHPAIYKDGHRLTATPLRTPVEADAPEEATRLTHSRSCGYHDPEKGCTCCLDERIAADNWRAQYNAWFKRANEVEAETSTLRARVSQLEATVAETRNLVMEARHDYASATTELDAEHTARLAAEQERDALWSKAVDVTLAQDGDPAELTAAIEALSEVTLAVLGREMDSIAASLGMGCTDG